MNNDKIISELLKILNKIRPINKNQKKINQFNFIDSGYLDSLEIIRFNMSVEKKFKIKIKFNTLLLKKYNTLGGLASIIKKKII
jgi:acyl carrier protein